MASFARYLMDKGVRGLATPLEELALEGVAPPDLLGFIALCLLQQGDGTAGGRRGVSRFRFPWGLWGGKRETEPEARFRRRADDSAQASAKTLENLALEAAAVPENGLEINE